MNNYGVRTTKVIPANQRIEMTIDGQALTLRARSYVEPVLLYINGILMIEQLIWIGTEILSVDFQFNAGDIIEVSQEVILEYEYNHSRRNLSHNNIVIDETVSNNEIFQRTPVGDNNLRVANTSTPTNSDDVLRRSDIVDFANGASSSPSTEWHITTFDTVGSAPI